MCPQYLSFVIIPFSRSYIVRLFSQLWPIFYNTQLKFMKLILLALTVQPGLCSSTNDCIVCVTPLAFFFFLTVSLRLSLLVIWFYRNLVLSVTAIFRLHILYFAFWLCHFFTERVWNHDGGFVAIYSQWSLPHYSLHFLNCFPIC